MDYYQQSQHQMVGFPLPADFVLFQDCFGVKLHYNVQNGELTEQYRMVNSQNSTEWWTLQLPVRHSNSVQKFSVSPDNLPTLRKRFLSPLHCIFPLPSLLCRKTRDFWSVIKLELHGMWYSVKSGDCLIWPILSCCHS